MKGWSNSEIPNAGAYVPEKRLLAAVLQRAVTDFLTGEGDVREGARQWLMDDDDDYEAPLSFHFICEALDLDVPGLRRAIVLQTSLVETVGEAAHA